VVAQFFIPKYFLVYALQGGWHFLGFYDSIGSNIIR
jgi:hypothetical protein